MRRIFFLIAPVPTVAASIALAAWMRDDPHYGATQNIVARQDVALDEAGEFHLISTEPSVDLQQACATTADKLQARLGKSCAVIVRAPLVLAGDMNEEALQRSYERTIQPAMSAMQATYFRATPHEPVTLLLFTHEKTYTRYAEELFGQKNISIYGYYKPSSRTLILNLGTGSGTLVHELTHALIDFDFPRVPVWFNEGLASLHEQCRFVETENDTLSIEGLANWRLPILQEAIAQGTILPLHDLTTTGEFLGKNEAVNYAQARYLCMFLQQRGLLTQYYAQFRENQSLDPRGTDTLLSQFPGHSWAEIDREFQIWARQLKR